MTILYVKESNQFRPAYAVETIESAKTLIKQRYPIGAYLNTPKLAAEYFTLHLSTEPKEIFAALWLTTKHQIINFEQISTGTIDGASVFPREVLRSAIHHNAAMVIFCHNHPSGNSQPSKADQTLTKKLQDALRLIDVKVLDHIIIGQSPYSFAEHGLI